MSALTGWIRWAAAPLLALSLVGGGCSDAKPDLGVPFSELPEAVQQTAGDAIGLGTIRKIEKVQEGGEIVYTVEIIEKSADRTARINAAGELLGVVTNANQL